jgi:hypothetical protein
MQKLRLQGQQILLEPMPIQHMKKILNRVAAVKNRV